MKKVDFTKLRNILDQQKHELLDHDCQQEISWLCFIRTAISDFQRTKISLQASSLAFFMVFSIFPFCLLLSSILARFGNLDDLLLQLTELTRFLPNRVLGFIEDLLYGIKSSKSLSFGIVGFFSLIWAASKGINLLLRSLYNIYERSLGSKTLLLRRVFSLLILCIMALSVLLLPLLLSTSKLVLEMLQDALFPDLQLGLISTFSYLLSFLYLSFVFSLLYHYASGKSGPFYNAMLSGFFAAFTWLIISRIFSVFLSGPLRYSAIMSSLTGLLALMLWLYFSALSLLIIAILHKQLNRLYQLRRQA
ncbi:MAG: YihY/virulence factor BrkB family protein [Eubacteriales bacterium]|nr:YihY/virulence factor BrkB family protein [Eubacteriales bacterium]